MSHNYAHSLFSYIDQNSIHWEAWTKGLTELCYQNINAQSLEFKDFNNNNNNNNTYTHTVTFYHHSEDDRLF